MERLFVVKIVLISIAILLIPSDVGWASAFRVWTLNGVHEINQNNNTIDLTAAQLTENDELAVLRPSMDSIDMENNSIPNKNLSLLWPNNTVPYVIDARLQKDTSRSKAIKSAIEIFNRFTCVKFVPRREHDNDYVWFMDGGERKYQNMYFSFRCYSYVGRVGIDGAQELSVGAGCERRLGVVLHEMMHAVGFVHEQSRPDRDGHVRVVWPAILPKRVKNFRKYAPLEYPETFEHLDHLPYDYASLLHYHSTAFTKNGRRTIVTIDEEAQKIIGQREGFSDCDLAKIYALYGCENIANVKCDMSDSQSTKMTEETTTTTPTPKVATCKDVYPNCARDLKLNGASLCADVPGIYQRLCAMSCKNCSTATAENVNCVDSDRYRVICDTVAKQPIHFCELDPVVKLVCPAICGLC